jgi:hypothetical protein
MSNVWGNEHFCQMNFKLRISLVLISLGGNQRGSIVITRIKCKITFGAILLHPSNQIV